MSQLHQFPSQPRADLLSNVKSRRPTHLTPASWSFAAAHVVRVAPPRPLSAAAPPMCQTRLVLHTDGNLTSGEGVLPSGPVRQGSPQERAQQELHTTAQDSGGRWNPLA